jgi:hypothetical protein
MTHIDDLKWLARQVDSPRATRESARRHVRLLQRYRVESTTQLPKSVQARVERENWAALTESNREEREIAKMVKRHRPLTAKRKAASKTLARKKARRRRRCSACGR